jgi:hypothetical protein
MVEMNSLGAEPRATRSLVRARLSTGIERPALRALGGELVAGSWGGRVVVAGKLRRCDVGTSSSQGELATGPGGSEPRSESLKERRLNSASHYDAPSTFRKSKGARWTV